MFFGSLAFSVLSFNALLFLVGFGANNLDRKRYLLGAAQIGGGLGIRAIGAAGFWLTPVQWAGGL
jgi:hypothetical protein